MDTDTIQRRVIGKMRLKTRQSAIYQVSKACQNNWIDVSYSNLLIDFRAFELLETDITELVAAMNSGETVRVFAWHYRVRSDILDD